MSFRRALLRVLLPLAVLAVCGSIAFHVVANRPAPERRSPPVAVPEVEVAPLARAQYRIIVRSRGIVEPRTESTLLPEISGRIVWVSPKLRAGEFFEVGEPLAEIDVRDYQVDVRIAAASLVQARAALTEERARAEQAARDWRRLGEPGEPQALALREPQLAASRAAVHGAEARLTRARLDLARTTIKAPYAGRVLEHSTDVGQYVSSGDVLARIYAVDYVEVRLPLSNRQLEFLEVPERYRRDAAVRAPGPRTVLSARVGRRTHRWVGRIMRAEGSIDTRTRQQFVVVQVDDPYGKGPADRPPLKVGQFVEAAIEGRIADDVYVIPRGVLRAGDAVLLVGEESRLERREVGVLWSDAEHAVIDRGLADGERLVITPLGAGMTGVEVRVAGPPREGGPALPPIGEAS